MSTDEREHAAALVAAISAHLGESQAYRRGDVPGLDGNAGVVPPIFVIVDIARTPSGSMKAAARTNRTGWRVTARAAGRTVREAEWALTRIDTALLGQVLTIGGKQTTPLTFDSSSVVAPDKVRHTGSWTYAYGI